MLKKTIKFEDLDGEEVSEDFYFHFTKLELVEMDLYMDGGLEKTMNDLIEAQNAKEAYNLFKKIVLSAYGKRSEDGRRFIKSDELTKEFEQSAAIGELIFEMLEDPTEGAKFVESVLPKRLVEEAKKAQAAKGEDILGQPLDQGTVTPQRISEIKAPTDKDVREMSREELIEAMKQRNQQG